MKTDDSGVFDACYREFYPKIYRYTFRLIGNHQEAEQLTQEAFASLYGYVSAGSQVRNVRALIYRIAHNACLNYLKRENKLEEILSQQVSLRTESLSNNEERLIKERRAALIRRALFRLPPRDQTCLLLYGEEFSYAEIAKAAGIKKTSVGKILARAAERLAQEIKDGDKP